MITRQITNIQSTSTVTSEMNDTVELSPLTKINSGQYLARNASMEVKAKYRTSLPEKIFISNLSKSSKKKDPATGESIKRCPTKEEKSIDTESRKIFWGNQLGKYRSSHNVNSIRPIHPHDNILSPTKESDDKAGFLFPESHQC